MLQSSSTRDWHVDIRRYRLHGRNGRSETEPPACNITATQINNGQHGRRRVRPREQCKQAVIGRDDGDQWCSFSSCSSHVDQHADTMSVGLAAGPIFDDCAKLHVVRKSAQNHQPPSVLADRHRHISRISWPVLHKGKGKGLDSWYSVAAYIRRLVNSSALQSWKWQLIGMG